VISIDPTTSMRMEPFEAEFIERTGVKMIIGKGFMGSRTAEACRKRRCTVTVFPGGCAALAAKRVKKVLGVHWLDPGVPDALWVLEVEELGLLIVTIDSRGNNMYTERVRHIEEKLSRLKTSRLRT